MWEFVLCRLYSGNTPVYSGLSGPDTAGLNGVEGGGVMEGKWGKGSKWAWT